MKSIKDVNSTIAERYAPDIKLKPKGTYLPSQTPVDVVEQVNVEFWRHVREHLSNPRQEAVTIKYLGTWYTTPATLFKRISYSLRLLRAVLSGLVVKGSNKRITEEAKMTITRLWTLKNIMGWRFTHKHIEPVYEKPKKKRQRNGQPARPTDAKKEFV